MSDRVWVSLAVPAEHEGAVAKIVFDSTGYDADGVNTYEGLTTFEFEEVNYGDLSFLDQLLSKGVAYDHTWSQGSEFGAGDTTLRFNKQGVPRTATCYDHDSNPNMGLLVAVLEDEKLSDTNKLARLEGIIREKQESMINHSWDNQAEYGRTYRALKLIAPTT